jgi:dephospho-CoA kinase
MAFKNAVVLTGGIATGKSSVAKIFAALGYTIIDADTIAHEILNVQQQSIAEIFGKRFVVSGKVDRKALGALVFPDSAQRKKLEALLHPLIRQEIERRADEEEQHRKPYLVDIPLFFESGHYPIEKTLVVYAKEQQQLERLVLREGYSKEEALARIHAQMSIEEKRNLGQYVIDNSGTLTQLQQECERVKKEIEDDSH